VTARASAGLDQRLAYAAEELERTNWAAELCDPQWRLVWVSSQLRALMGGGDDEALGVGMHLLESRFVEDRVARAPEAIQREWLRVNVPLMLSDTPGGHDALRAMVPPEFVNVVDEATPTRRPAWTMLMDFQGTEMAVGEVRFFAMQMRNLEGKTIGTILLYGSALPATLLALVARGNRAMFERMARLVEPGRREAAIIFADVQASGALSRRLPSAAYFDLIRDLTTEMDEAIIEAGGIVGKNAGDGVTGFFLVDDLGSPSATARAAIASGRRIAEAALRCARAHDVIEPDDLAINVGLHWGGTLYMGQVVTGGRLEVTALGDEVNEAARLQQTARDGAILVSKSLVERLNDGDAASVGLDPDAVTYATVAELAAGREKIVRDAGTIAVTRL
jgi:class 3 adenylate cyclase